jgi:hypothetical protein
MTKLTKQQAIIITGYTGITACKFDVFHEDVERRLNKPVFSHQFADPEFMDAVRDVYQKDFMEMAYDN